MCLFSVLYTVLQAGAKFRGIFFDFSDLHVHIKAFEGQQIGLQI